MVVTDSFAPEILYYTLERTDNTRSLVSISTYFYSDTGPYLVSFLVYKIK